MVNLEHGTNSSRQPAVGVAVLIGGFMCAFPSDGCSFWGIIRAALQAQGFRVITVSPSPVGSLHDRACQIFYELKGGMVCYGEEHSRVHRHACHGETLSGKFPEWDERRPIHVFGHSFGGQTARMLQHLVTTGFFSKFGEYSTGPSWIRSVTACNSPLNGSLIVYTLGEKADTAPAVNVGTLGHLLSVVVHVVELLDCAFLRRIFDPRLSHFRLSLQHLGLRRAWAGLWRAVLADSAVFALADNAAFDMTVHSAQRWNQVMQTDPLAYYFSISGIKPDVKRGPRLSRRGRAGLVSKPMADKQAPLSSRITYAALETLHARSVRFHERTVEDLFGVSPGLWSCFGHDGVLEAFTQSHPRVPKKFEAGVRTGFPRRASCLKPGIWHNVRVKADHMWTNADADESRQVFARLACSLRLIVDSDAAAAIAASSRGGHASASVCTPIGPLALRRRNAFRTARLPRSPRLVGGGEEGSVADVSVANGDRFAKHLGYGHDSLGWPRQASMPAVAPSGRCLRCVAHASPDGVSRRGRSRSNVEEMSRPACGLRCFWWVLVTFVMAALGVGALRQIHFRSVVVTASGEPMPLVTGDCAEHDRNSTIGEAEA